MLHVEDLYNQVQMLLHKKKTLDHHPSCVYYIMKEIYIHC